MPDGDPLTTHDAGTGAERILAELQALRDDVRAIRVERERLPLPRALQVFVMFYELKALADGREFTTPEIVAHAKAATDTRLRASIEAICGEIDARKLAKVLSQWRGKDVGLHSVIKSIGNEQGWILWKFEPVDPLPAPSESPSDALMVGT